MIIQFKCMTRMVGRLFVILLLAGTITGFVERAVAEDEDVYRNLMIFSDVVDEIEKRYVDPVTTDELIKKAVQGMVKSLDPHSAYLDKSAYESLQDDTRGEFSGIGVVLTIKDDILTVISPIEGTPAYRAGMKAGDVIIKVNGEPTHEMSINEAVNKIKGPKGTPLTLTIMRKGEGDPIDIDLVRDDIPLESVKFMMLKPGYGYIAITNFNENTSDDLVKALVQLESDNGSPLSGVVLDLRGNPGGLLQQAIAISDMFISSGIIVKIKGREDDDAQIWKAHDDPDELTCPLVVLINGGSASASEIVAGALQDHKRALILGTTSFGKGSVQSIKPLGDGSALKLTVARYFTPSGRSIQAEGIRPDIELKFERLKKQAPVSRGIKEKDLKNHLESVGERMGVSDDSEQELATDQVGIIKAKRLNMRSGPDVAGAVVHVLKTGDEVTVIKRVNVNWLKVSFGDKTGYITDNERYVDIVDSDISEEGSSKRFSHDILMRDNQVVRALELLISHAIFSGRLE